MKGRKETFDAVADIVGDNFIAVPIEPNYREELRVTYKVDAEYALLNGKDILNSWEESGKRLYYFDTMGDAFDISQMSYEHEGLTMFSNTYTPDDKGFIHLSHKDLYHDWDSLVKFSDVMEVVLNFHNTSTPVVYKVRPE